MGGSVIKGVPRTATQSKRVPIGANFLIYFIKNKPGEGDLRLMEGGRGGGAGDTGLGLFVAVLKGVTLLFRGFKSLETGSWTVLVFCSNLEQNYSVRITNF